MKLHEVLERVPVNGPLPEDVEVRGVTTDSRLAGEGCLFIAIPGLQADGTKYAASAVQKGAVAVVAEKAVDAGAPVIVVPDAREATALIAANFHGRPAERLQIVGVTGTSGKTTTTKMVESILDATGEPAGLIGTIEYRAGDVREIADRTTPDAVALQEWFAKMVDAGVKRAVMEVSSHALALRRTHGVPFAAAVFTNLSRDHFDFHKDFEDYFAAKRMLFDQIDRSRRTAIVNADDEYGRRLAAELGEAALTFSMQPGGDIHPAEGFVVDVNGLNGTLVTPFGPVRVESSLLGTPNLMNWMAAIGAALTLGLPAATIEAGIRNLPAVRGRFERVESHVGTVLVDYAHKPDALEKLLHAVRDLAADRRVVIVFGCGGDRDRGKRPIMGEIASRLADHTIVTSDNPRTEDPEAILREIEKGVASGASVETIADRRQAIERAVELLDERTVVVIAGKGHENYQVVGDRIVHFDDREEAEAAIRRAAAKKVNG